ncbi:Kojibiose phosphorylase [compost metagenome]
MLASDVNELELAYDMFAKAARIDLGTNMHSCDEGIHSASIGGIWKAAIMGFGGVRSWEGSLRLNPKLPQAWERLSFPLAWQGERLQVTVTRGKLEVERLTSGLGELTLLIHGREYVLKDRIVTDLKEAERSE